MTTMRPLVAHAIGEPADVVRLEARPMPEPGPGQVRIRVQAAPVNPNDLHILRGRYGFAPALPAVLCQEAVGLLGTWQDYVVADAQVICTERENLGERVAHIVGDDGVHRAIDCVAGQVGADASRVLAPGGQMIVYGALSSHRQTEANALTIALFARSMIYDTRVVRGFWLYRWFSTTQPRQIGAAIARTSELVGSGPIRIVEGQSLPPEQFAEALELAEAPAHGGKPLLLFGDRV
jgi:NADPH:quinone reductase-like Zn-dependent oxidoreductase